MRNELLTTLKSAIKAKCFLIVTTEFFVGIWDVKCTLPAAKSPIV